MLMNVLAILATLMCSCLICLLAVRFLPNRGRRDESWAIRRWEREALFDPKKER